MSAGYLDIFIDQGQDFSASVTLDNLNGVQYNLTDYTAAGSMRSSYISANSAADFIITVEADGIITLALDYRITQNLAYGKYVYDVFLINAANNHSKVLAHK